MYHVRPFGSNPKLHIRFITISAPSFAIKLFQALAFVSVDFIFDR